MLGVRINIILQIVEGRGGFWDKRCGFKGFSGKAAQDIFSKAKINRWAFDVEVLVLAKKLKYNIKEIPVTWINDAHSKVNLKGMIIMLWEILQIRFHTGL